MRGHPTETTVAVEPGALALAKRPFYLTGGLPLATTVYQVTALAVPAAGPLPLYTREVETRQMTPRSVGVLVRVRRRLGPVSFTVVAAYGVLHALHEGQTTLEGYTRFGSERLFRAAQVSLLALLVLLGLVVWWESLLAAVVAGAFATLWMVLWGRFQRDREALLADLTGALAGDE